VLFEGKRSGFDPRLREVCAAGFDPWRAVAGAGKSSRADSSGRRSGPSGDTSPKGRSESPEGVVAGSPAQLCLAGEARSCYLLPPVRDGAGLSEFGFRPKLERLDGPSGDLFLFYAHCGGGSGTSYRRLQRSEV
jgi:hypothetical protein